MSAGQHLFDAHTRSSGAMKTKPQQINSTVRASNQTLASTAMSPSVGATAQYKKVLSKGPMPMNGKVLDDYDEEDELYEDDIDEQSPGHYSKDNSSTAKKQLSAKKGKTSPTKGALTSSVELMQQALQKQQQTQSAITKE